MNQVSGSFFYFVKRKENKMIKKFVRRETGKLIATLDECVSGFNLTFIEDCNAYSFEAETKEEAIKIARTLVYLHNLNGLRFTGIK